MIDVVFKEKHIIFLLKNLSNEYLRLKFLEGLKKGKIYNNKYPTDCYKISFSSQERDAILDELSILLTSIGLDCHSEINENGLFIEDLIDLFF